MKKTILIILLSSIVLVGTLRCGMKDFKIGEDGLIDLGDNFKIYTEEMLDCENEVEEFYSKNEQKIFTVCLDKITLKIDNKEVSLKNILKEYGIDGGIGGITKKLKFVDALNDGGTTIFRDGESAKFSNNGITIIKCKTVSGNRNVYIGNGNLDYFWGFENGFCGK